MSTRLSGEDLSRLLNEFHTPESLRAGVVDAVSELRRHRYTDLDRAATSILFRIQDYSLTKEEELQRMRRLFVVARFDEVDADLDNEDMPLDDLERMIRSRKFQDGADVVVETIAQRHNAGIGFSEDEMQSLKKLRTKLDESFQQEAAV